LLSPTSWSKGFTVSPPVGGFAVGFIKVRRLRLYDFGNVKLFRTRLKDPLRHYVVFLPDAAADDALIQADFQKLHDQHWQIEQYQRMIKQACNIEKFQFMCLCPATHSQYLPMAESFISRQSPPLSPASWSAKSI